MGILLTSQAHHVKHEVIHLTDFHSLISKKIKEETEYED